MKKELWMPILNTAGAYEVSTHGNIKSVPRILESDLCVQKIRSWTGRILKPYKNIHGYLTVTIITTDGYQRNTLIHRLVASAFIPNPENKPCVNHMDGIRSNNNLENLEWVTHSENARHSFSVLGRKPTRVVGIDSIPAKPVVLVGYPKTEIEVISPSITAMANYFGFGHNGIRAACDGKKPNHRGLEFRWGTKQEYIDKQTYFQ